MVFPERCGPRCAIDRGTRSEDKALDSRGFSGFEKMEGSSDVGFNIKARVYDRRPDPRAGGEMDDCVRFFCRDGALDGIPVSDIDTVQADVRDEGLEIPPLYERIVEII